MGNLILHSLKDKKNWFILNIVICVVVGIILPLIFKYAYSFFAYSSIFLSIVLIIVNAYSELTFLHDDRKLGYYLSKPLTLTQLVNIKLITSIIFCIIIFVCTFFISSVTGALLSDNTYINFIENNLCVVQIMFAWTVLIIFTITLSSILTGNTAISVLSSVFIFAFPLIILLLISYILNMISLTVVGMNTDLMINLIIEKFFNIEKIYFFNYDDIYKIDIWYIIRLVATCALIYILALFAIKRRKNEKTGEFIVHSGYKYFMAIFASLIAPMLVTMIGFSTNMTSMIITLVVLSILSYYILISIFNKSFKLSINSIKIYVPFMIIFLIIIYLFTYIVNDKLSYIPQVDEIEGVYVGSSSYCNVDYKPLEDTPYHADNLSNLKFDSVKDNKSLVILKEKENIENVIELQKKLIDSKLKNGYNLYIIYYLKNGKTISRVYNIPNDYIIDKKIDEKENQIYDCILNLISADEFISKKFVSLCDEEYLNNVNINYVDLYNNENSIQLYNFDYSKFANCYINDYKNLLNDDNYKYYISENIFYNNYDFIIDKSYDDEIEYNNDEEVTYTIYINFHESDECLISYTRYNKDYVNVYNYINSLISD